MPVGVGGGLYPSPTKGIPTGTILEIFTPATDYNFDHGDYRVRAVGTNAAFNFTFRVPFNYASLILLEIVAINNDATPGAQSIDLFSDYGAIGQASNFFSESDLANNPVIPAVNSILSYDISSVYSSLAPNQFCGLMIQHNAIGGRLDYLGIRAQYAVI
jgi:hypothetical protein